MTQANTIDQLIERILACRDGISKSRSILVGLSGIDGSGKGYTAGQVKARLAEQAVGAAVLHVDDWLNLPAKRLSKTAPARNFYENAVRFDDFFSQLAMPLHDGRSLQKVTDFVDETRTQYKKHLYDFKNVDVIVVEGIFLFKRHYRKLYDLAVWVDCSFPTALARAIDRRQEGLSLAETIAAYETIYFPAQRIHFAADNPRETADLIFQNDSHSAVNVLRSSRKRSGEAHFGHGPVNPPCKDLLSASTNRR